MSDGEVFIFLVCLAIALFGWIPWYNAVFRLSPMYGAQKYQRWFSMLPLLCIIVILLVLMTLASFDVVISNTYIMFYIVMGLAWLVAGFKLMYIILDVSWRDDALERVNPSAVYCITGGIIGVTAIYSGANIGDGPGWWTVVFAGGIGVIVWFILLFIIDKICNVFEKITINRDPSVGLRMCFYMIASGILLGRGAGGDWTSAYYTIIEFLDAWPVLIVAIMAIIVEKSSKPVKHRRNVHEDWMFLSITFGIMYILISIAFIMWIPPLPINPIYGSVI